jgi:hypothetical protein
MREERGLRVHRCSELVGRPFEAEATDVDAKRGVDFSENAARDRKSVREILSHPRLLRALAWEQEYDVHV